MRECDITLLPKGQCSHCTGSTLPDEPRDGDSRPPRFPSYATLEARRTKAFIAAVQAERRREYGKGLVR